MPGHIANGKPGSKPKLALFRSSILLCTGNSSSWAMSTLSIILHRWWLMSASGRGSEVRPHYPLFRNLPLDHLFAHHLLKRSHPIWPEKQWEILRFVPFSSEWKELWLMSWKESRTPRTLGQTGLGKQGGRKGLRKPPEKPRLVLLTTPEWWVMWFCISELCENLCDET